MTLFVISLILFYYYCFWLFWLSEDTPWYFDFRYLSEKCQSRQNTNVPLYPFLNLFLHTSHHSMSSYQPKNKTVNNTYNICTKELTKAGVVKVVFCFILVKDLSQDFLNFT